MRVEAESYIASVSITANLTRSFVYGGGGEGRHLSWCSGRDQRTFGISFLLPLYESWGANSGHGTQWQAPFSVEPSAPGSNLIF